ncbi:MAG: anthranilate phosphoribosyltransferase [Actinobacteria bacterium]|uniref:anthranilate phosphoribosyltransferase n=1 Tax=freshwater metagenome TaxID=449393 RepID=A0A6J7G8C8_9ZZZZ|nr:anthranilate phosphoribosyltransferase [Actinomycetota bacterium]
MAHEFTWTETISSLLAEKDLSIVQATWAMNEIVKGQATDAQLAGFLVALRAKGESVDEVVGFREAILANAVALPVSARSLDIVGTGGDGFKTVNVSSMAAIVCAAAGVPVVKHGNRAASSASGSSDVLSELGIDLTLESDALSKVFDETGIVFAFASAFHPGFRHAAGVRSEMGIPTVFNILGPLCNPAQPKANAIGVAVRERVALMVGVLQSRDATALVFRGDEGLDELSIAGHSHIWEVSRGRVVEHDLDPRDLGLALTSLDQVRGGTPSENATIARATLSGQNGPVRDIVVLNAAAGLSAFELMENPAAGDTHIVERLSTHMARAAEAIDSGAATAKLEQWAAVTRQHAPKTRT